MPVAARSFPSDVNPPLTAISLRDGLKEALIAAGFPPALKSYNVGTDQFVVWELILDPTKAYGRAFYRLKVTTGLIVTHAIGGGWTDATNTLVNPSAEAQSTTYLSNVALKFWGFRNEEILLLSVTQGSVSQLLGYFRLTDAPAFDEASFPRIFIANRNDVDQLHCTGLTPYAASVFTTSLLNSQMSNPDAYLQQRSQTTGFFLYGPTSTGVIARSSDDLAMGACTGMVRGDVFQVPNTSPIEQYILLRPGVGALLIRI